MNKILIISLLAVFIGACAHNPERIVIEKEKLYVPEFGVDAFRCPEKPPVPEELSSPEFTERDVALFMLELAKRGDICSNKLDNIKKQIDEAREIVKEKNDG